jgi:hypothetical protein
MGKKRLRWKPLMVHELLNWQEILVFIGNE